MVIQRSLVRGYGRRSFSGHGTDAFRGHWSEVMAEGHSVVMEQMHSEITVVTAQSLWDFIHHISVILREIFLSSQHFRSFGLIYYSYNRSEVMGKVSASL